MTCEAELHCWVSRMQCPMLSHMGKVQSVFNGAKTQTVPVPVASPILP